MNLRMALAATFKSVTSLGSWATLSIPELEVTIPVLFKEKAHGIYEPGLKRRVGLLVVCVILTKGDVAAARRWCKHEIAEEKQDRDQEEIFRHWIAIRVIHLHSEANMLLGVNTGFRKKVISPLLHKAERF
jgi:hypothetical protein